MKAFRSLFVKSHRNTRATRESNPARSVDSHRHGWREWLEIKKKRNVIDAEFTGATEEPGKSVQASPVVDNETSNNPNSVLNFNNLILAANIVEKIAKVVDKVAVVAPVAALLCEVLKTCKEIQDMGENRNTLNTRLGKITKDLDEAKTRLDAEQIPGSLKKDIEEYAGLLAKALTLISGFDGQNRALRAVNQKEWTGRWTALERELDSFASRFIIKRGIETQIGLSDVQISALEKKLREWLKSPPDMAEKQHATQKLHHEGTGNWFLNGVIAQLFNIQATAGTSAVAYFYFDFRNEQNQLVEVMLRSIILQLSAQSPNTYAVLDQQYKLSKGQTLPTYQDLLDILDKLLLELGSTYIVLDALDECKEHNLLVQLISQLRAWSKTPLHLLFTSQTRELFTASFEGVEHVPLELETTQEDIAAFVTSELDSNPNLKHWARHTAEITRKVVEKSNGMFPLAACQLFEIYDRFLESIDPNDFVVVKVALRWLVCSARPLSLAELEDVLAFDFSDPDQHVFQPTQRDDCANRVCSLLEGLVTVRYRIPILAHASVADYLKSPQFAKKHKCDLSQGFSHTFLAQTCVGYLLHFADHPLNADTFPNYPLSSYAAKHWSYRLLRCDDRATLEGSTMRLLESGSDQYAALNHLHNPIDQYDYSSPNWWRDSPPSLQLCSRIGYTEGVQFLLQNGAHEADTLAAAFHAASKSGHANIVRLLLEKGADVNAVDAEHESALQAASNGGHTETVRLLLEKGADVNAKGGEYGNALQAASEKGNPELVRILLKEGADVNTEGGSYGTALQAASYGGSPEIVRILLKEGADVNAEGGSYGTALQAASYGGSPEIVRILLKEGADVNAAGGEYGNALQASSIGGHTAIVRLLLEKGADVNAAGGHYGSALQAASYHGSPEIVRILLKEGADVNAAGGHYGSVLQAASEQGSPEIVRLLLEKGTDVNATGGVYGNALQAACVTGKKEMVRILLEKSADVNAAGGIYGTALRTASCHGHTEIARLLLEKGADVNASGDRYGSPLQDASWYGDTETVQLLREHGAVDENSEEEEDEENEEEEEDEEDEEEEEEEEDGEEEEDL
ncbi:ankyrin repeat-containing domain protein [Mycena epipterygia]|nr:ankyrin repeat-containing domain protein [Mycena epipterygia]